MEGLDGGDHVGAAGGQPGGVPGPLAYLQVGRREPPLGHGQHARRRLDPHDALGAGGPPGGGQAGAAAQVDHQPRACHAGVAAQHVQEHPGRARPDVVVLRGEVGSGEGGGGQPRIDRAGAGVFRVHTPIVAAAPAEDNAECAYPPVPVR